MSNVEFWTSEQFFARLDEYLKARGWKLSNLGVLADVTSQSLYALRKRKA